MLPHLPPFCSNRMPRPIARDPRALCLKRNKYRCSCRAPISLPEELPSFGRYVCYLWLFRVSKAHSDFAGDSETSSEVGGRYPSLRQSCQRKHCRQRDWPGANRPPVAVHLLFDTEASLSQVARYSCKSFPPCRDTAGCYSCEIHISATASQPQRIDANADTGWRVLSPHRSACHRD